MTSGWKRSAAFALAGAGFALASLAPAVFAQGSGSGPNSYPAPDKACAATVTTVAQTGESELAIARPNGKVRFRKSFASPDGQHGARITKAAWTPDSRFFVFILEISGGHQPWHHPMFSWDRKSSKLYPLDDQIGGITGGFTLAAPDVVKGTVLGDPKSGPDFVDGVPFSVSLSSYAAHYPRSK